MAGSTVASTAPEPVAPGRWYDKWRWYELSTSKEEKALLFKLDFMILTFGCLTFFTKASLSVFLDLQAFQNAYVSGMKEDIGMEGNDLQYTTGVFQAGYCAAMIPSNIILTRVRPNLLIPAFEVLWGILTLLTAYAKDVKHVYIIRFFSGVFECVAYPGMFAGYFQTACYTNLNGVNGLAGWRWLFIVCGCITLPVAILGLTVFPARPDSKHPSWLLTADQITLARRRVSEGGSEAPKVKFDRKAITDVFKGWHWYAFVALYYVFNQAMITNGQPFNLYLKAHDDRYSISQINNLPTGQSAISIVAALIGCYWADATGKRWLPSIWICGFMTIGAICMAAWNIPEGLKFFAFYVAGLGGALNPLFMSWASEVTFRSAEERAVVVSSMNAVGQALLAGLNIVTFPTPQAPRFKFGWYWVMANNILQFGLVLVIMTLHNREKKSMEILEGQAEDIEQIKVANTTKGDDESA
ncbi:Pantothenate transporter FEN2 [Colletotrichum sp. SAR 10_70]|nr:Pantothenate transporter FEN2 [Colletotrichum sp. SAR 10_71]KAI8174294.1 Pantothenate transporter FEN2 [Colletotrichum sp. SAR 10_75]KAI8199549.1 Pantothenate transporter FEN2 [Colletotrichum sp. SAR 10_76]KAI8204827.1 Pantothenate transporter FEN2 [Colletotrichum sp. SAR 10_70]KAI8264364.1 Pantothenate transporter FEN2 [Colletotrichum sp. SAR 10_77]KAJ4996097.1 Pantothenate transporter FEN2 [Colletotrichum sp. SAR 10_66]